MARRGMHYESAFEHYLRSNRVPYVAVDEARKALMPRGSEVDAIKSFDYVIYGPQGNLLIDVKGRRHCGRDRRRFENWVTRQDMDGLERWSVLFGVGFRPMFVFVYWCEHQPPDALFEEMFEFDGRWYALREVSLEAYRDAMTVRSPRWGTVSVPAAHFDRISGPFSVRQEQPRVHADRRGTAWSDRPLRSHHPGVALA